MACSLQARLRGQGRCVHQSVFTSPLLWALPLFWPPASESPFLQSRAHLLLEEQKESFPSLPCSFGRLPAPGAFDQTRPLLTVNEKPVAQGSQGHTEPILARTRQQQQHLRLQSQPQSRCMAVSRVLAHGRCRLQRLCPAMAVVVLTPDQRCSVGPGS